MLLKGYRAEANFGISIKEVKNCTGYGICSLDDPAQYKLLSLNYRSNIVQKEIEKINSNTLKLYNRHKNSKFENDDKCSEEVRKTYYHPIEVDSITERIINDDYVAVCIIRTVRNLCTNIEEKNEPDIMIYDVKEKKILTQEEFKKKEKITDEMIDKAINTTLDYLNDNPDGVRYEFKDVDMDTLKLYYGTDGNAHVIFFHNTFGSYETGLIVQD